MVHGTATGEHNISSTHRHAITDDEETTSRLFTDDSEEDVLEQVGIGYSITLKGNSMKQNGLGIDRTSIISD